MMSRKEETITPNDLIIYMNDTGNIMSAGNSVDFLMSQQNVSTQTAGQVYDIFKNLSVPLGLSFINNTQQPKYNSLRVTNNSEQPINETIYDELFKIVTNNNNVKKNKQSRKNPKRNSNKYTKKHK
jgi:hypothetical protein